MCLKYRGITLLILPGKLYSKMLKRKFRISSEPQIQEEQCAFQPGYGTTDQLYTLVRGIKGHGSLRLFCGSGEGFQLCSLRFNVGVAS